MRLLLDTHVLLWWLAGADRLSEQAAEAISRTDNDVIVSTATLWELAIKQTTGKFSLDGDLRQHIREQWFEELSITGRHTAELGELPLLHRDPFDRILVAQVRSEDMTLVTADRTLPQYDVRILAAC